MNVYDVSINPTMVVVEQWWYSSSDGSEHLCVDNKWSSGLKPTVFHEGFQTNLKDTGEGVGGGTGGDGKGQEDEDEHRRCDYKDPVIQLMYHSYMHIY